jgi:hypothetical protein
MPVKTALAGRLKRTRSVRSAARLGRVLRLRLEDAVWHRTADGDAHYNESELRVFGLKRSGNHVIINWIFRNHPGTVCFLNNVQHELHFNPYLSFGQAFVKNGAEVLNFPPEQPTRVWRTRRWHREHPHVDCLIHSYEDRPLDELASDPLRGGEHDRCVGRSGRQLGVIVLRDPFNTLASRLRRRDRLPLEGFMQLWKSYAREFLGDTGFLSDRVAVSYNRWCVDAAYRAELAERLGLSGDLGVNDVPLVGGGSSFDATAFDGKGGSMRTGERWRQFAVDPDYLAAIRDEEVLSLSARIFGEVAGTDVLLAGRST